MPVARTPRDLADQLRTERRAQRLTQAAAGSRVGLLPKTVSALESKPDRSSVASLYKLLSALGLEIAVRPRASAARAPAGEW